MDEISLAEEPVTTTFGGLLRCPECHSAALEPVQDGEWVNFWCTVCERCWHVELNRVIRIDPATCGGCERAPECTARYAADHDQSPVSA